ncbi:hypothetical protein N481_07255 [Pseudoalteromonas luteoviolacea S4047-1]|uniref:Uncharacterized protein n=1 Tax=Pseudoalteromonas luteoviolacea S4054 TaxID=1129367 RepID=A0A0F6ADK5_9GAMM|nr:hypothetical protein N479_10160 [Pseudoalteromonas luteoviolacea S4054]KZN76142.1 hypothetical protein N481_07255 [Pseudoalteromonas luteoviolacea S4047-1]
MQYAESDVEHTTLNLSYFINGGKGNKATFAS